MEALGGVLILIVATGAFFAAPRFPAALRRILGTALLVLALGIYLLFWAPSDYLVRRPGLVPLLHPYRLALYVAASLALAAGIGLGLLARTVHDAWPPGRVTDDDGR